jgi:hypothetical protein
MIININDDKIISLEYQIESLARMERLQGIQLNNPPYLRQEAGENGYFTKLASTMGVEKLRFESFSLPCEARMAFQGLTFLRKITIVINKKQMIITIICSGAHMAPVNCRGEGQE